jgi:rhodanese-related sulfurtransferase
MMARARAAKSATTATAPSNEPVIIDVRSPQEFRSGAYPGAINIDLDELQSRVNELGSKDRDITLYCASGARSAYAQRMLQQMGFKNVKNGGGLMHMMMRK